LCYNTYIFELNNFVPVVVAAIVVVVVVVVEFVVLVSFSFPVRPTSLVVVVSVKSTTLLLLLTFQKPAFMIYIEWFALRCPS
jgi:hypothetical protein